MNRFPALLALLLLPASLQAKQTRELTKEFEVAPGQKVRIEIPVAELEIEGGDRSKVEAELTVRCRWDLHDCEELLEDIELASRSTPRRLTVEILGLRRWHSSNLDIEGTILVPRSALLEVEMGVAELDITGIEQEIRVDLGVGEVRIRMPKNKVGEAFLDVGVGKAELSGTDQHVRGERSFLVGSEVRWEAGSGEARIDVEVGVGKVWVRLD